MVKSENRGVPSARTLLVEAAEDGRLPIFGCFHLTVFRTETLMFFERESVALV